MKKVLILITFLGSIFIENTLGISGHTQEDETQSLSGRISHPAPDIDLSSHALSSVSNTSNPILETLYPNGPSNFLPTQKHTYITHWKMSLYLSAALTLGFLIGYYMPSLSCDNECLIPDSLLPTALAYGERSIRSSITRTHRQELYETCIRELNNTLLQKARIEEIGRLLQTQVNAKNEACSNILKQ